MPESSSSIKYQYRRQLVTLTLSSEVGISMAAELQQTMLRAVMEPKAKEICINLADVERMDIAAIQLFLALRNECVKAERIFKVEGMTPAVENLLSQIGIPL